MTRVGIRGKLFLVVVVAVGAGLSVLLVGFNILLAHNLSRSADNLVRARAGAELALLRPVGDRLIIGETPDDAAADTGVWVFSGGRVLEAPRQSAAVSSMARRLAGGPARILDLGKADVRLYAAPVVVHGRRLGTVVASVATAPYEQSRRTALIGSLVLGAAVLLLVALAARWLLASTLRPVARMTQQAAAWGENDLDSRFALGDPHDELSALASTFDGLLNRLAASLRREQRFSAELSHELRTPLSRILVETELALRRERQPDEYRAALELVQRNAEQLGRTIDALVAAARLEAGAARGTADALTVATGVAEACAGVADARSIELEIRPPPRPIRLGVEPELAERVLQPVVENACRYGRGSARISIERSETAVVYEVNDDGPGVAAEERERIFEPGARGQAGDRDGAGAGLGLALSRRLARSAAGDVEASSGSGGRFRVRLPAA